MEGKSYIANRSFKHGKMYLAGDVVELPSTVIAQLVQLGLVTLKWRPDVIPLVAKPKPKSKKRTSHKTMIKK